MRRTRRGWRSARDSLKLVTFRLALYANGVQSLGVEFRRLQTFERSSSGLFTEADLLELEIALLLNPEAGAVIPGARGLRKLRRPLAGRGKSGGARVIYY